MLLLRSRVLVQVVGCFVAEKMTENDDGEKSAEVVGRYGKEYSRLRRLTSNLDVIQQSVRIFLLHKTLGI